MSEGEHSPHNEASNQQVEAMLDVVDALLRENDALSTQITTNYESERPSDVETNVPLLRKFNLNLKKIKDTYNQLREITQHRKTPV